MEVEIETSPKTNGQELSPKLMEVPEIKNNAKENQQSPETPRRVTRSRSKTPKKQPKKTNITPEMEKIVESAELKNGDSSTKIVVEEDVKPENENLNGNIEEELKEKTKAKLEQVEMDPLVLNNDEPDPELEFDETSDMDSATGSPIPSRCRTRRSLTRNIPTPKTPKTVDNDPEPEPEKSTSLDHTYDSIDVKDLSTKAEVGGDSTRLDFEESMGESFLESCKNRSIRGLSARRSIRPTNDVYLKRAIRNNHERSELTTGLKRKNRSETPEDRKKMKTSDSTSSLFSMISSPFLSIKNKFSLETTSSTPKLTGYKDENGINYADDQIEIEGGLADKKNWCTLM